MMFGKLDELNTFFFIYEIFGLRWVYQDVTHPTSRSVCERTEAHI